MASNCLGLSCLSFALELELAGFKTVFFILKAPCLGFFSTAGDFLLMLTLIGGPTTKLLWITLDLNSEVLRT